MVRTHPDSQKKFSNIPILLAGGQTNPSHSKKMTEMRAQYFILVLHIDEHLVIECEDCCT
jgi:hypothetical protein